MNTMAVFAWGSPDQPVEWDGSYTGGLSLSYQGLVGGCKKGVPWYNYDHKFTISNPVYGPYDPDWYRLTSDDPTVRAVFQGKSVMGYNLGGTSTAYFA